MAPQNKIAIVLLADVTTPEGMGRMANALVTALECLTAGDAVKLVFDGAGTKWIGQLARPEHKYHELFESVRGSIAGVCRYCADAYKVPDEVTAAGLPLTDEFQGHPSLRSLVAGGYQVITLAAPGGAPAAGAQAMRPPGRGVHMIYFKEKDSADASSGSPHSDCRIEPLQLDPRVGGGGAEAKVIVEPGMLSRGQLAGDVRVQELADLTARHRDPPSQAVPASGVSARSARCRASVRVYTVWTTHSKAAAARVTGCKGTRGTAGRASRPPVGARESRSDAAA